MSMIQLGFTLRIIIVAIDAQRSAHQQYIDLNLTQRNVAKKKYKNIFA